MTTKKRQFQLPCNTHPLIQQLADIISASPYSVSALGRTAGVGNKTIHGWFRRHNPSIHNLDAVLNVLGYRLTVVAIENGDG
jgi:DNA-binding phage protein